MSDNWNELMKQESSMFQADMLNDELAIANKANAINARLAYEYHGEVQRLTAENAKLRAQLAEAVAALQTVTNEMETVIYSGFDPERWGERMEAISEAGKVLAAWNKPEPC